jgi:uncharacterized protein (DUF2236 family)
MQPIMPDFISAPIRSRLYSPIRKRIRDEVLEVVHGGDMHLERFREPAGDPGLLGPDSMAWRVHSFPAGMLTGGFAALMLQSLHPLAMAGVDEHSDYRTDPVGRLNRTARYVTVTTFGPTEQAEAAFAKVRQIHTYVHGAAPDGRPYRADDPDLLTWVHTAETWCFLAGYQTFAGNRLTKAEGDQYFAEVAPFAERLGAADPPRSAAEAEAYLTRIRPELRVTPAALAALSFLRGFGRNPQETAATKVLMNGGISLLPGWARSELGVLRPLLVRIAVDRPAVLALSGVLTWACGPSEIAAAARERIAGHVIPAQAGPADEREPITPLM